MGQIAPKTPPTTFDVIDDALSAMRNTEDGEVRRMQHAAVLRLVEQVLRLTADRVAALRRAA
jgi:hypothetical protein